MWCAAVGIVGWLIACPGVSGQLACFVTFKDRERAVIIKHAGKSLWGCIALVVAVSALAAPAVRADAQYTVTGLGFLGGGNDSEA